MYETKTGLPTSTLIVGLVISILLLLMSRIGAFDSVYPFFTQVTQDLQISNLSFFQDIQSNWDFFFNIDSIRKDNLSLTSENEALKGQVVDLQLKIQDYQSIASQQQFNKEYNQVPARIIKYSEDQTEVFINKGLGAGVNVNDVAVVDNNLLGIVSESYDNYAKVNLISSNFSTVPVIVVETGSKGVATGQKANTIEIKDIPNDKTLLADYTVVSAGTDGIIPYGLILGKITSVSTEQTAINQSAVIKSMVKLNSLNSLFIITNYP